MTHIKKHITITIKAIILLVMMIPHHTTANGNNGNDDFIIKRYNINSGLSSDYLTAVWQDKEGYLWMATSNGLNRFDGYTNRIYKPQLDRQNTFNSVNLNNITGDNEGNLWIGTDHSGINIFNKKNLKVKCIDRSDSTGLAILDNNINYLFTDSKNRIWICSFGGLNRYDTETSEMITYSDNYAEGSPYPFGTVSYAYEDKNGKIMIGTWGNGLYCYNENSKDFTQLLMTENSETGDTINRIVRILEDHAGNYWLGTWEGGLYKTRINNYGKIEILEHFHVNAPEKRRISSNIIYCLYEAGDGRIWAGTPYGLNIIPADPDDSSGISLIQSGEEPNALSHNDLFHIYEDRSGIIWLATGGGGLNKINPQFRTINNYTIPEIEKFHETQSIRAFIFDRDSSLLVGVQGLGFGKYNLDDETFIPYTSLAKFNGLPENINAATAFFTDNKENLWIGTRYTGLFMISPDNKQVYHYLYFDPVTGDRSRMINAIFEDQYGYIWVGTNNGLFKLVRENNNLRYNIHRFLPSEEDPHAIAGEFISTIYEDSDSVLWIGTVGGAINHAPNLPEKHNPEFDQLFTGSSGKQTLRSNIVYDVHEDRHHRLWFATGTAGLALYDKKTGFFTYFLKQAGVREDAVFDIIEEGNNLWLSTNNGLIRFRESSPENFQVEVFTSEDGLLGNFFIDGAFYKAPDGRIFAGGYYGFNVFCPEELISNTYIPPLAITGLWVGDASVNVYDALEKGLVLKYNQNNLMVEFSALSFAQPNKNKYAYKMSGLDANWHRTNYEGRQVNYTHLPPGTFTLLLNASNNSDLWNPEPLELFVRVKPHPVRSWWAIMIYTFVFFAILITIYYFLINNIKIKQAYEIEKLERKKDDNINQFKFRFFTNISHELLTPLSVLSFSLERLFIKKKWDPERMETMDRNIKRIMHLVSQLLDFRKMESGSITPLVSKGRIDLFINQIYQSLKPLAEKKNITVKLKGAGTESIYFDPDKVDKIISNLLSNALKYTPANGQIMIQYDIYDSVNNQKWLKIMVTDSGKGIEPEMFDHVFERFYQVKSVTGKTFGAGIGLALAKNLTEVHKGTIHVDNAPNMGARFTVIIPVSVNAYHENEILREEMSYQTGNLIIDHDESLLPVEEDSNEIIKENEKKTVLIVEDNSDFRNLLREHLSNYYNTLEAENGQKGYDICLSKQPDLVITDMMMPVMNGIELCKKIKNSLETSDIIVILLTAKMDEETRYESYLADADSYISKPVNVRTLYTRVESLLEQRSRLVKKFSTGILENPSGNGMSVLDEKLLEKIRGIIEQKLMNTELNVLALTKEVGMSNSNLYRKITRLTGMSPVEYIRFIRLQAAARMIINEGITVSEAAYASGFNDLSYFSKRFKKQFGMNPKNYQKHHSPS